MARRQPLGLKERQRILEMVRQGLSAQQIARRLGIALMTARKILAKGLAPCDQCGRVFASGERCPVCSLPAEASFGDRLKASRTVTGLSQFGFALLRNSAISSALRSHLRSASWNLESS